MHHLLVAGGHVFAADEEVAFLGDGKFLGVGRQRQHSQARGERDRRAFGFQHDVLRCARLRLRAFASAEDSSFSGARRVRDVDRFAQISLDCTLGIFGRENANSAVATGATNFVVFQRPMPVSDGSFVMSGFGLRLT